jgi:hypothetical protein
MKYLTVPLPIRSQVGYSDLVITARARYVSSKWWYVANILQCSSLIQPYSRVYAFRTPIHLSALTPKFLEGTPPRCIVSTYRTTRW